MRNRALAYSRCFLPILVAANLSSCAGTTTQQAPLPPGAVEAEQQKQLELVLSEGQKQQARLDEITRIEQNLSTVVMGAGTLLG